MKITTGTALATIGGALYMCSGRAEGCVFPPPEPPPSIWIKNHGINENGKLETWIGIETDLFGGTGTDECVCGLALSSETNALPPITGDITGAMIAFRNSNTGAITPLSAFDFSQNPGVGEYFETGPTADGYSPAPNGSTWTGFSALVDHAEIPSAGTDEVGSLWFAVEFDVPNYQSFEDSGIFFTFGAGTLNNSEHLATSFGLFGTPTPGGVSLGLIALGAVGCRRRRGA